MLTVFRFDTPHELKHRGEEKELRKVMAKIYDEGEIEARISEIEVPDVDVDDVRLTGASSGRGTAVLTTQRKKEGAETYHQVLCDPHHCKPTWIGIAFAFFQQLTGINAFVFYSSQIFEDSLGMTDPIVPNFLLNIVAAVSVVISIFLLDYAGRRTLMCVFMPVIVVALFGVTIFAEWFTAIPT